MNSLLRILRRRCARSRNVRMITSDTNSRKIEKSVPHRKQIKEHKTKKPTAGLPSEADVVIIGGGALGCSALYHLAKIGITNSVLLEAHQLTAGTTWHSAGLLWRLRPSDIDNELVRISRELLMNLENETGVNPGWINNGGLFIASTKTRLDEYKRLMSLGKAQNIESHVLGPSEAKQLYPLLNIDDVFGTLYSPGDGTVEPAGYCNALVRSASLAGAKVIEHCPVTDIATTPTHHNGKQVTKVHTPHGDIKTQCVINATGCWANSISQMVGVTIPLVATKHAYVVTERIPGIENMPNVRDHDASVYLRLQGDALSIGGYESNPIFLEELASNFSFSLFDLDWDVFGCHIDGAVNRIPCLEQTGIKSTVCGPESFTPDHKPLMGEDPTVSGFFHCCGFNSAGIMLSGGCGHEIAQWVLNGRPQLDMFAYDIRRFHSPLSKDKKWVKERSHESYAKNYSIVFPHDQPLAGRMKRKSPLHPILEENGCVFEEVLGWERPGWFNEVPTPIQPYDWYGSYDTQIAKEQRYKKALEAEYTFEFPPHHAKIGKECMACRNNLAVFDMTTLGKFLISGKDAQKAADWLFSANMQRSAGQAVYTCMVNKDGGTEADLTVSILEEKNPCFKNLRGRGFYMTVAGATTTHNWAHVQQEIRRQRWDVQLEDHTEDIAVLSLQGPDSRWLLESLIQEDFSNETFPFSSHREVTIAGVQALALRISFVGELGWELHIPSRNAIKVLKAVEEEAKGLPLVHAGYRALDSLSAEKGYKHWHSDVRTDDTPLEAGLGFTCKLKTSTPFLGREVLEKQKRDGLKKKLITLTLENPKQALWGLEALWRDADIVGHLRRAEYAFSLGRTIAYGYVRMPDGSNVSKEFLKTGTWRIESMGEQHDATVHLQHPFDPKNLRLKGIYPEDGSKE